MRTSRYVLFGSRSSQTLNSMQVINLRDGNNLAKHSSTDTAIGQEKGLFLGFVTCSGYDLAICENVATRSINPASNAYSSCLNPMFYRVLYFPPGGLSPGCLDTSTISLKVRPPGIHHTVSPFIATSEPSFLNYLFIFVADQ